MAVLYLVNFLPMNIVIQKPAMKVLKKLQPQLRTAIVTALKAIGINPFAIHRNVTAMQGATGWFRLRHGNWRVLYQVDRTANTLSVEEIKQRGVAYR